MSPKSAQRFWGKRHAQNKDLKHIARFISIATSFRLEGVNRILDRCKTRVQRWTRFSAGAAARTPRPMRGPAPKTCPWAFRLLLPRRPASHGPGDRAPCCVRSSGPTRWRPRERMVGIAKPIWLIGSGGVSTAATTKAMTIAHLRFSASAFDDSMPTASSGWSPPATGTPDRRRRSAS